MSDKFISISHIKKWTYAYKQKNQGHAWTGDNCDKPRDMINLILYIFSSVQLLSHVWLFVTPWITARQAFLSITISQITLRLMSIDPWCHPAISSSVVPFSSCPQSLPASESFPMSQLLHEVAKVLEFQL